MGSSYLLWPSFHHVHMFIHYYSIRPRHRKSFWMVGRSEGFGLAMGWADVNEMAILC